MSWPREFRLSWTEGNSSEPTWSGFPVAAASIVRTIPSAVPGLTLGRLFFFARLGLAQHALTFLAATWADARTSDRREGVYRGFTDCHRNRASSSVDDVAQPEFFPRKERANANLHGQSKTVASLLRVVRNVHRLLRFTSVLTFPFFGEKNHVASNFQLPVIGGVLLYLGRWLHGNPSPGPEGLHEQSA